MLFSLHDWEAPYIAAARDRFVEIGVIPVIPSPDVVHLCLDKFRTWRFMRQADVLSPATFLPLEEAEAALDSGEIAFPLIVKPRFGQGSIELQKVEDREELRCAYALVASRLRRGGRSPFLRDGENGEVMVQACIEGREYGVDIINDLEGDFVTAFVKRKFAMRSGETDVAETASVPAIAAAARKIAGLTRHPGILDADFFLDREGRPWLLEMNPRFGGGYPFSHAAGANVPAALIAWAEGREPDRSLLQVRLGVRAFKAIRIGSRTPLPARRRRRPAELPLVPAGLAVRDGGHWR
jgi:carbamoyl-phosphate synthase large subunit